MDRKKTHDFVDDCLLSVDFKMGNQKEIISEKKKNGVRAHQKLSNVYDEKTFKLWQCQNWFTKEDIESFFKLLLLKKRQELHDVFVFSWKMRSSFALTFCSKVREWINCNLVIRANLIRACWFVVTFSSEVREEPQNHEASILHCGFPSVPWSKGMSRTKNKGARACWMRGEIVKSQMRNHEIVRCFASHVSPSKLS